ncbi:metallophosphoesterase, partial [Treponema sp.]|uniref:metallophosphoesterase n=1 Tax=Treponema sp. TaxID=166 RepID=UPI003F065B6D
MALVVIVFLATTSVLYNIYDNNRFVIVEQNVIMDGLPEEFDGYRILHISDLHGKYLGENQSDLLATINALDYDCIILTGDMNKFEESDLSSSQAVFDLLNGLENKDTVLWVDGNTGPFAIETVNGSCTGKLTSIGNELEEVGVTVLLAPVEIKKENESIWFVPELSWADIQMNYLSAEKDVFDNSEDYRNVISYGQELQQWYEQLNNTGDVKIRVNHFPIQANMTQEDWNALGYIDYDLSIAGHYHGGQL